MTHNELITEARKYTTDIPRLSGEQWATLEMLPKVTVADADEADFTELEKQAPVTVADAVMVSFEGDEPHRKMFVLLARGGKFIASGLEYRKNCQGHG